VLVDDAAPQGLPRHGEDVAREKEHHRDGKRGGEPCIKACEAARLLEPEQSQDKGECSRCSRDRLREPRRTQHKEHEAEQARGHEPFQHCVPEIAGTRDER
jgi:hypothetical protein